MASWAGPAALAVGGAALIVQWLATTRPQAPLELRVPVVYQTALAGQKPIDLHGFLRAGDAKPGTLAGAWPSFRGWGRDNIDQEKTHLAHAWPGGPPTKLWQIDVAEGYAGATVADGRAYVMDYDTTANADVLRCLSTTDGHEIWRRGYQITIGRNHGITRTVCAIAKDLIVSIGPKCQVLCTDARTGEFKWGIDLVRELGTTEPPWYTGQNPLIDDERVILAPGGKAVLMMAVDLKTGAPIWKTANPRKWDMTHSSIMPTTVHGKKIYLYCASGGLAGVNADDGSILFELSDWKVSMANVPSPLPLSGDRVLLSGGYGAGSLMIRLDEVAGKIIPRTLFRLTPEVFGAEQHTPIFYNGYIYGVIPAGGAGELVCLDLDGKQKWASGGKYRFGLGAFLIADGVILLLNDTGALTAVEATETAFKPLGTARLFEHGHDAWGPMALVDGRLFCRDMTRLACYDLREAGHD